MKKFFIFTFILFLKFPHLYSQDIMPIREGNENSKIKIIVYESLTCGHCANFHNDVYPDLKKQFIDNGLVSIEFKNFPLDLAALNASKLAHCKNDGSSMVLHYLYRFQSEWVKGNNILDINKNLKKILESKNFDLNFENCINDKNIENFILEERISGSKQFDIQSTPTLIINNKKFEKKLNFKNLKKTLEKML